MGIALKNIKNLPKKKMGEVIFSELSKFLPYPRNAISAVHIMVPPNGFHEVVKHAKTTESVFVLKGSAVGVIGNRSMVVKAGDYFVITPGTFHSFTARSNGVEALCFFSPPIDSAAPDVIAKL